MSPAVTIIIPTLNASGYIENLIRAIGKQDYGGRLEILIVDSSSDDQTLELSKKFECVRWIKIPRLEFTHGYARNLGVREAAGEWVVFLSQDALPHNENWLKNLLRPLMEEGISASFSRQVPYDHATPMEAFFLRMRFSSKRRIMRWDLAKSTLGLLDVFFSNVSSAAKRDIALEVPFQEDLIMSEDQQFSRDLLKKGHRVSYEPGSIVWHSHRYNLRTIFQRYFDSAYSLTCIFDQGLCDSFKIGIGYYLQEWVEVVFKHPLWLPYYVCYLMAKTTGALAGHYAKKLPLRVAKSLSMHKGFWDRPVLKSVKS